jgi:3-dehydroquinate dehydratase/shikimate dehydrogenase
VQGIGAANTLVFRDDQIIGYNTDYRAAMDSLTDVMNLPSGETPLNGRKALVLGAGGVAKAIAFGLTRRGAKVAVAARNPDKARGFRDLLKCQVIDWESRHTVNADVLVNCTPIGMHPNVDETPFDRNRLRPSMTVFDTVYNPEQTLLIKNAKEKHGVVVTGVDMFIRQAALQFQYFTGQPAPMDLMREVLKRTIGPVRY